MPYYNINPNPFAFSDEPFDPNSIPIPQHGYYEDFKDEVREANLLKEKIKEYTLSGFGKFLCAILVIFGWIYWAHCNDVKRTLRKELTALQLPPSPTLSPLVKRTIPRELRIN